MTRPARHPCSFCNGGTGEGRKGHSPGQLDRKDQCRPPSAVRTFAARLAGHGGPLGIIPEISAGFLAALAAGLCRALRIVAEVAARILTAFAAAFGPLSSFAMGLFLLRPTPADGSHDRTIARTRIGSDVRVTGSGGRSERVCGVAPPQVISSRRSLDMSPGTMVIGTGRLPEFLDS